MFSNFTEKKKKKRYPDKSFFYCPMTLKGYGKVSTNKYKIDDSKLNLLFFGNVVLNKRLDLLIQAVKELPIETKGKVHLTIAGKCSAPQQYMEQIGNDESISAYFKRIDDCEIAELFTKHDFLVLPHSMAGVFHREKAPLFASSQPREWVDFFSTVWSTPGMIAEIKSRDKAYLAEMNEFIINEYKRFLAY